MRYRHCIHCIALTISLSCAVPLVLQAQTLLKPDPDAEQIIGIAGARLTRVFSTFGFPDDITGLGVDGAYGVVLDYGNFGFKVVQKTVTICFFWSTWTKLIKEIKIGDEKSKVRQAMGEPQREINSKTDGSPILLWDLPGMDAYFVAYFKMDETLKRVQIEMK